MFSLQVGNVSPESLGYLNRVRQRNSLGPSRDGNNFAVSFTSYPHCHPHHHKLFQLTLFLITILIIIHPPSAQVVHCTGYIKNWPPQGIQMERSVEDELHASRFILPGLNIDFYFQIELLRIIHYLSQ